MNEPLKRYKLTYYDNRKPVYINAYSITLKNDIYEALVPASEGLTEIKWIYAKIIKNIKEV